MTRKTIYLITFTSLISLTMISGLQAQFSRVGGGLNFSTGIENDDHKTGNPGIGARALFELGDKFLLIPEAVFYMPGKRQSNTYGLGTTFFGTVDANLAFKLATEGKLMFYALGGANMTWLTTSYDGYDGASNIFPALNLGTGIEMIVEKDLNGFAQLRGVIGPESQYLVISLGVHYYIKGRRYRTW